MTCLYRACGKTRNTHPGLSLYSFPVKDKERCRKWIENSGNPVDVHISVFKFKGLCQDHFIDEDFVNETKHRLIKKAVPCHFKDPQGAARKKEREQEFNEIQPKPLHFIKANLLNGKTVAEKQDTTPIAIRNDLFPSAVQYVGKKEGTRCQLKKVYKKKDLQVPSDKRLFQWLNELREKRDTNKHNISYYVNVDDVLARFESSNLFDLDSPWYERSETENRNLKCYSRRNRSNKSSSAYELCQQIKNDECENKNLSSSSGEHFWRLEEIDKNEIALENQYSGIDIKHEEISECQYHWSEDDKSCIKILDVPKLQSERFTRDKDCSERSRKNITKLRKINRRKRYLSAVRKTTETEKYIYIINRNRILINKLKSKLKMFHKKFKMLERNQSYRGNKEMLLP